MEIFVYSPGSKYSLLQLSTTLPIVYQWALF